MTISREIKTAVLVISSILLFIWGYSFLKGSDLLSKYKTLYVEYNDVSGLMIASPVTINGFPIGKVKSIKLNNATGKSMVEMEIKSDFPIKKTCLAEIFDTGLLGGKGIAIIPNFTNTPDAVDGDILIGSSKLGLIDGLSGQVGPLKVKLEKVLDNVNTMMMNINDVLDEKSKANIKASLENLNQTLAQFKTAASQTNTMLAENKSKISGTMNNIEKASANFNKVSDSLTKINMGSTVKKLESTLASVDKIMLDLKSGKGTMGKMLKDETLYNNFAKTSKELELLLQDVRLQPTRYVNVSLFGKKNKPYVAPPASDTLNKK